MAVATYPSLRDRVVFVTGGASGIGAAFTRQFHAQGARVAFVDLQRETGESLRNELGERVWFGVCDVTDVANLHNAVQAAAEALGPITVLINNVANDTRHEAASLSFPEWRANLAVNLDPVFIASTAVLPMMEAQGGGAIINVSSVTALLGQANLAAYVAAKGAIIALTKTLGREWGARGVRVNALTPGWVVTERQLELWLTPHAEAEWAKLVALPGRIMPDDIARAALFLASDESRMMTGQNLVVDAGRT
ncbi:MAG TPA: SDR family NAD(P)-dependent oxidoreductase [Caulobacteraceae bacterium]|jgi:NAD(P)-dependent dehydrogenase (short-subunit alcohol dehydrogenase family)